MNDTTGNSPVRQAIEIAVNLGLVILLLVWCFKILTPFISLIVWGAVIAISIYTPFLKLTKALGDRKKLAVTLIAVCGLALVIVPAWMFAGSVIESSQGISKGLTEGTFHINPPSESVKEWPLVGKRLHKGWSQAATNFQGWLEAHREQVGNILKGLLAKAAGIFGSVLQFIFSILIAAVFLASAESARAAVHRFFTRLVGEGGEAMLDLSVATIRSVAVGVLGIAFIQAVLGGAGMMMVGIPGAGLLALAILILAIAQLPPLLILLPVAIYVFSVESTTVAVVFMVWSLIVSFSDAVLKPIFLGRGVEAPMLVILLGAIGGMIMSGIMGLFVGAVVLALGYTLFQAWLTMGESDSGNGDESDDGDTQAAGIS